MISDVASAVPLERLFVAEGPIRRNGDFVLYWMTAFRRTQWNFALQRAVEWAKAVQRPLLVVEVLRCGGRWDSDRHHRFVLDGMADNRHALAERGMSFAAFVERTPSEADSVLGQLAAQSCVIVTDDYPLVAPVPTAVAVRMEWIDSNGLLPLKVADKAFTTAYSFRRFLQKTLPDHLIDMPAADPLKGTKFPTLKRLPKPLAERQSSRDLNTLPLASLPINHAVAPVAARGGPIAAGAALKQFVAKRLPRYNELRNEPEENATSGLSPYLRYGHIATHEVFHAIVQREKWSPARLDETARGRREGWWGMSESAEAFLDQLITWREVGYNFARWRPGEIDRPDSLPDWARATLDKHARDKRDHVYALAEFEAAKTHDRLWNAAQQQLVREGAIHNYLRMLWGKKIVEWSPTWRDAAATMIELNNKYALDGCDPNSYSGIFWVLGRYDRPWGPERPVFGTVRYMSSANTARKLRVKGYIARQLDNADGAA